MNTQFHHTRIFLKAEIDQTHLGKEAAHLNLCGVLSRKLQESKLRFIASDRIHLEFRARIFSARHATLVERQHSILG